jgi:hypothetical protein
MGQHVGMGNHLTRIVASAALGTCALVACGDDDGDRLLKPDYIKQADELCRRFVEEGTALADPTTVAEKATFVEAAIELADELYADFEALDEPEDAEDVHERLLLALEQSTAKMREAQATYENGDEVAGDADVDDAIALGQAADDEAKAYGFEVCGSEDELTG